LSTSLVSGNRLTEQEALTLLTALIHQHCLLLFVLNTFGSDRQPQTRAEPDQGANDRGALRVLGHRLHKAPIDLDGIQLEIA
jgi:hypothetical protein